MQLLHNMSTSTITTTIRSSCNRMISILFIYSIFTLLILSSSSSSSSHRSTATAMPIRIKSSTSKSTSTSTTSLSLSLHQEDEEEQEEEQPQPPPLTWFHKQCIAQPSLTCTFTPTTGNKPRGSVTFKAVYLPLRNRFSSFTGRRCFVQISALLTGLTPGYHGFHIHSYGDLRSSDGKSAGGHFANPWSSGKVLHGYPWLRAGLRHWGDLGNINASRDGVATYKRVDHVIHLSGIRGRGMVIHELKDMGPDAQPSGSAGSRQAHCVIGFSNPDFDTVVMPPKTNNQTAVV